ncbi:GntR family transcriptional regulator [Enterococcus gallinarum]|uniref:GntR family transcriptional regulator n=1 Tax=Enterococcus TaxID=1350 RepID=UPI0022DF1473|nr:GntR family transcriptional regulator [Enterococcus gallinarum]MEB5857301.1 GntR family transcriptional regulator [Enterococcus gallinarum]
MPKYQEIANILRTRIKNKTYPPDSLLPNQIDLVEEFQVSRMTIKKAIGILSMEGLVYSQRGAGTKILNHPFVDRDTTTLTEYVGLSTEMRKAKRQLTSEVIDFQVAFPDKEIQEKLMLTEEQPVYKIIRLRILEGRPFILEHTYMPVHLVPNLKRSHLETSIYQYVKEELGIQFVGAYRTISADKSSLYDQKYLACDLTDPVLEIQQIVYQKNGSPIEYSRSRNRYDTRVYSYLDVQR